MFLIHVFLFMFIGSVAFTTSHKLLQIICCYVLTGSNRPRCIFVWTQVFRCGNVEYEFCHKLSLPSGGCSRFTGGSVYYYSNFLGSRPGDATKFGTELEHLLTRPIGLEAVLRVRASRGIKMTAFHGNFFLRSTDLLSLPNVTPDNSYAVEMSVTENMTTSMACFQTALLHTNSNGIF